MATIEDFQKVDIRVGKIVQVEDFPEAKKSAYKLKIDFGVQIGIKQSSVQIVDLYTKEELLNKIVIGVVNFPSRKIGPFDSEVLTLGVSNGNGKVILLVPDKDNPQIGGRVF